MEAELSSEESPMANCDLFVPWEEAKYIPTHGGRRAKHAVGVQERIHLLCSIFPASKKKGKSILFNSNLVHILPVLRLLKM